MLLREKSLFVYSIYGIMMKINTRIFLVNALVIGFVQFGLWAAEPSWVGRVPEECIPFLEQVDKGLSMKVMGKMVPRSNINAIYTLAQEEDMEVQDGFLISDELLRLLNKKGILDTEIGSVLESLQNCIDGVNTEERMQLIEVWRSLWLNKVADYARYVNGLKKIYTLDFSTTVDFDTNVKLSPEDQANPFYSEEDALGINNNFGVTLRPFINSKDMKDWSLETRVGVDVRRMSKVEVVQYDEVNFAQSYRRKFDEGVLRAINGRLGYSRSFSQAPGAQRLEFERWSLFQGFKFRPMSISWGKVNKTAFSVNLGYRNKDDFANPGAGLAFDLKNSGFDIKVAEDFYAGIGGKTHTLGWYLRVDAQSTDQVATRDYSSYALGLKYGLPVDIPNFSRKLLWNSRLELRKKTWDSPVAGGLEDEFQFSVDTNLRAVLSENWSTRLGLSYLTKDQSMFQAASQDIKQFRIAWTSTYLTF